MSCSPYLQGSLRHLLIDHARIGRLFFDTSNDISGSNFADAIQQHEEMIEEIAQRNADAIVTLTHEHWQLSRDDLMTLFPEQGLNEQDLWIRGFNTNISC